MKVILSVISLAYLEFVSLVSISYAVTKLAQPAPGTGGTLQDFINLLINILQAVVIPFLVVCMIYAGFLIVTAGGNEQQVTKGKTWIFWTLIGVAIILSARVISDVVYDTAGLF